MQSKVIGGLIVTQNKKHVIPKVKYGRKRREYFHNEEREQRVQQERQARKQREEKAEILAKNNEERGFKQLCDCNMINSLRFLKKSQREEISFSRKTFENTLFGKVFTQLFLRAT